MLKQKTMPPMRAVNARALLKVVRTKLLSLHSTLRSPRLLLAIALTLGLFLFCLIYPIAVHRHVPVAPPHHTTLRETRPIPPSNHTPNAHFDRTYDAAWSLLRDRGDNVNPKKLLQIAYFVQISSDSIVLLPRLFARIHNPRNYYVVHVDAKVPLDKRDEVAQLIKSNPNYRKNMYFMEPEMLTYKGISMVTNTLSAMTIAMENNAEWDYFINLSGADYPLLSVDDQARVLARPNVPLGHLNFISFFNVSEWKPYSFRIRYMHWDSAVVGYQHPKSYLRYMHGKRTHPFEAHRNFTFTKAEAWLILSRPFVKFTLRSAYAKRMLLSHIHTLSVPEHYFGDVLYNHPVWSRTIVPDAFRTVLWYLNGRRSGQHPYVLDKGRSTWTFWEALTKQRTFFARKVSKPDSELLQRIDLELNGINEEMGSEQGLEGIRQERKGFFKAVVEHFDTLTKEALNRQGVSWPSTAYPSLD